jgi:hypothetical protein
LAVFLPFDAASMEDTMLPSLPSGCQHDSSLFQEEQSPFISSVLCQWTSASLPRIRAIAVFPIFNNRTMDAFGAYGPNSSLLLFIYTLFDSQLSLFIYGTFYVSPKHFLAAGAISFLRNTLPGIVRQHRSCRSAD